MSIRDRAEAAIRRFVAFERGQQPIWMLTLQITFDALRAEHPLVEWKILPRLKADYDIVLDLELDAALLATEATMRFYYFVRLDVSRQPHASIEGQVRTEAFTDVY